MRPEAKQEAFGFARTKLDGPGCTRQDLHLAEECCIGVGPSWLEVSKDDSPAGDRAGEVSGTADDKAVDACHPLAASRRRGNYPRESRVEELSAWLERVLEVIRVHGS